jgi:hypothetical protein
MQFGLVFLHLGKTSIPIYKVRHYFDLKLQLIIYCIEQIFSTGRREKGPDMPAHILEHIQNKSEEIGIDSSKFDA